MKRLYIILLAISIPLGLNAQLKFRYGLTAGLNLSTAVLPDLKINTNLNSILRGENVVQGEPQLADMVSLYKGGVYFTLGGKIGNLKLSTTYTRTNIYKKIDVSIFSVEALNILLDYLDVEICYNLNLSKHFYISAGYIPSFLLHHKGNLNVNDFDQRLLSGFGFRFSNGIALNFDAILGINEVIDGSYIHNLMIPITLNIPLKK